MADRCKEDSVVACFSVNEVRVVRRFRSNKGVLVVMQVVRVHFAVYSVSVFSVQSLQLTACGFELAKVRGKPGSSLSK